MDSWLWDPPIPLDEDNFSLGGNWESDFCFRPPPDPIANDAANEAACIQELKILIPKADADIVELEEEIILLKSQLALADEAWSEMCFAVLRENIESLEMSIKRLKNKNLQDQQDEQEGDAQSQIHYEPAKKIHEILKPLLEKYFQNKDEQRTSSNVKNPVFNQSKDESALINSLAEVSGAKTSGQTTTSLCVETRKGHDGDQNRDTIIILDQLTDVLSDPFESNQRILHKIDAESNIMPENDEKANAALRNASGITSSCEAGSNSRKWGGSNDYEGISTGGKMPCFTNEGTILNPSPKSKEPTVAEPYKLADMVRDSMHDAVEQVTNKSIMKQPMEVEENVNQANKIDPRKQLVTIGRMGTRSPPELKENDSWRNDRECTIAESLRELLNNNRKAAREPEIMLMPLPQILAQMQNTEITAPEESESNLLLKHKLEQKHRSQLGPAQEPSLAVEMELKPSSLKNLQNWKSMTVDKNAGNSNANRYFGRQTLLDFRGNGSLSATPDVGVTSDSQSEKKRKYSPISPVIKENQESGNIQTMVRRHKDTAQGMIQKDHLMNNRDTTNDAWEDTTLKTLASSASKHREPDLALEFLPMGTLRQLAKVNNLTGYSRLRKEELLKLLKAKSQDGDWREI